MANKTERLKFLINKFNIIDDEDLLIKKKKFEQSETTLYELSSDDKMIGLIYYVETENKSKLEYYIASSVFNLMVESDPTNNKMYTQWMLNVFTRLIKSNNFEAAIRFANEDLPIAGQYLELFESNKRKQIFKNLCAGSFVLKGINDPTDINQYKSLSQLFDAIDPFIERDISQIESLLYRYVDSGQASIGMRDRKFTIYIPYTRDASIIFDKFANWCTCKIGNSMFDHYTKNHKTPSGKVSKIYIIINNEFFNGVLNNDTLHQIHFETDQIKDRTNTIHNVSIFEKISSSDNVLNYFHDELIELSKEVKSVNNNLYLNYLIKFGFSDGLFEVIDEATPLIIFKDIEVPKLPNMRRFKNLEILEMNNVKLKSLDDSLCALNNLEMLVLRDNKLETLPSEIGNLKNLVFINIIGNKLTTIPESIRMLDKSFGGKLHRIAVSDKDIGEENYNKLKKLLPNVIFG